MSYTPFTYHQNLNDYDILPTEMQTSVLISFTALSVAITIAPGNDTALVTRSALNSSERSGVVITSLGIALGCLIHGGLSAMGVTLIIREIPALFGMIQIIGSGYLIYLGVSAIRATLRTPKQRADKTLEPIEKTHQNFSYWFLPGFITNVFNPKVLLFYLTTVPQFINSESIRSAELFTFGLIHSITSFVWFCTLGFTLRKFKSSGANERFGVIGNASFGVVFIFFGIHLLRTRL